ncbi:Gfo/Idh/MocA family protein [Allorhizobium taibaishanense]|uniref:NAD-binding protein n=1 Tax=Allorhizobium taibaishanense TaxID=887144 RepID=A0A1Q9A788_9HYPH|nr:Gfo/Idh/MocA family oxidoreductase [Allorhizobium taibaishanense]MBB4008393.1 putative dehydrogenase [Allorhizobium taibaishanense]OLP50433.1 NAD-binding protein [Allorhizobium taibaishanense]
MTKCIRWGILGCASIARSTVIPAIQTSRFGRVEAIASRSLDKAKATAEALGIPRFYGDYEALLADPEIDAIYNPLPNHLHVPLTLAALRQGKPVLCEKPIALSAVEAKLLVEASAETGLPVTEAFMVRHHPQWKKVRDLIDSGRIGELRAIQTVFSYFLDDPDNVRNQAEIGGGGLYDVGCYALNTARYAFGSAPLRAIGLLDRDVSFGTDRLASGLLEFSDGRQLSFTCATQLVPTQRVTLLGTRGRIEVTIPFNAPLDATTTIVVDDGRDLSGGGREVIEIETSNQYRLQVDAFAEALIEGRSPQPDLSDAVANMRAIDALFRSVETGRWEAV